MTQDQLSAWSPGSSDAELIAAVRKGATAAFGVLYERHAGAARTVARQYMTSSAGADDIVADAFVKVLAVLSGGGGPTAAFRAYLFTVVRRLAYVAVNQSRRVQPTDDAGFESVFGPSASCEEPALEQFERSTVAKAYKALPERWQAALWYSEVEGLTPAQFAPSLGLTANGAAALAYRAREGLRQQYLQQHLAAPPSLVCAKTNALLAGYVRAGLSKRDTDLVESHLESCGECRGLLVELGDVSHGMRAIIAPLVFGIAGVGVIGGGLPLWGTAVAATAATVGGAGVAGGIAGDSASGATTSGATTSGATGAGGTAAGGSGSAAGTASAAGGAAGAVSGVAAPGIVAAGLAAVTAAAATASAHASTAATATSVGAAGAAPTGAAASSSGASGSSSGASASASASGAGAGTGVAGAASAAGATGLGAALAGVPALLVGVAAVVVVGAGVAISAALGVFSGAPPNDPPTSAAGASEDATSSTDVDQPSPSGPPSTDPSDPANILLPSTIPTADTPGGPGSPTAPSPGTTDPAPHATAPGLPPAAVPPAPPSLTGPTAAPTTDPTTAPTTDPTTAPTTAPTTDPTTVPTTDPTAAPTTGSTAAPGGPALLQVSFDTGTRLVARQNNTVAFSLSNTADVAATNVAVALTVPGTLRFIPESPTASGVFGPRVPRTATGGWSCAQPGPRTDPQVVHCVVHEIAPADDVTLTLTFYAEDAVTADLAAQVFVGQDPVGEPWPFTSLVHAAPARLSATVVPVADLVAGQPGHLALTVTNGGQLTASDPQVVLALPEGSGLSWRAERALGAPAHDGDPGSGGQASSAGLRTAPGSTPGWACAVSSDGLACAGPQVDGDRSATVIVPVAVAAESGFTGAVAPATTFASAPVPAAPAVPSELSVVTNSLSAASILKGQLQVAHVAGALGAAPRLTLPDAVAAPAGVTVREAMLVWSGQDAQGIDSSALSTVELRTDSGGFAREQVAGSAAVLPADAGTSSYWGTADVTALVAGHAQTGRWFLAPTEGTALPADLTWSLTVVYEHASLPTATVTVLVGAPGPGAGADAADSPAAEQLAHPLALPAWGPVRVAVTGTVSGDDPAIDDLTVNGTTLTPLAGDLPAVVTYRSASLLTVPEGERGPLALSLDPGANTFAVLAVHSTVAADDLTQDRSGVLDQVQTPSAAPAVTVEVAEHVEIGDGVQVPVTVRNDSGMDLADVVVTFALPAGVSATAPADLVCRTAGPDPDTAAPETTDGPFSSDALTCDLGALQVGGATVVLLTLTAPDGLVLTGEVGYTVLGTDPVTEAQAEVSGAFTVTAQAAVGVRGTWHGSVAVTEVGAPLMWCAPISCWLASASWWDGATNDLLSMRPLNDAGGVTSSSSATVTIPEGATVQHAGLYWSANRKAGEAFSQDLTSARLRPPGSATYAPVVGEVLGEVSDSVGRTYYQSYADVTDVVAAHGSGEWAVADVALAQLTYGDGWDNHLASRDHYAGWSLVVVYEDATLSTGSVTVVDSPVAVTKAAGLSFDIFAGASAAATLGVVGWEGDRRVTGDQLLFNDVALRPVLGGSTPDYPKLGSAVDAFNSTAWGSTARYGNSLGVDAKKFAATVMQPGANTVSAITTGDEYVIGVVTITTR